MIVIIMVAVFCVPLMYLVLWAITFYGSSDTICIVVDSVLAEGMICAQLCKRKILTFWSCLLDLITYVVPLPVKWRINAYKSVFPSM